MSGTGKSAGATCAEYLHSSWVGLRLSQEYVFVRNISFLAASRISGCLVTSVSGQTQISCLKSESQKRDSVLKTILGCDPGVFQ